MDVFSLKSFDDTGLIITSSKKGLQHGRRRRAWKSMEELPIKDFPAHECNEKRPSLPSSPTPASAHLQAASIFPTAGEMDTKTGHLFFVKDYELQETSTQLLAASEKECCEALSYLSIDEESEEIPRLSKLSDGAGITELAPPVKSPESQVASTPCGTNDVEHPLRQDDIEVFSHKVETSSKETNCIEQTLWMEQEISTVHSKSVDCTQHEDGGSQDISTCITNGLDDNQENGNTLSLEACSQMFITTKENEDMEHASEVNNIDCQESRSYVSTPPKRTDGAKHTAQMESTIMEVSLHDHLHQDNVGREEPSTRNFIMHRFLPAAQEIAAMEHESFIAFLANRNQVAAGCPSPSKPQRPPIAHRIKTRAHQASKGFTAAHPFHATQQDDVMSLSMKSCGFFCLGLKSALFRAHRSVSTSRKKSCASHLASHVKVSDKGSSFTGSKNKGETEVIEGLSDASHMYSPSRRSAKFHEMPRRHAMKCHANFNHSSVECNPLYSQLGKLNVAGHIDEQMVLIGSPSLGLVGTASKRQEETVIEGMATHSFTSTCRHDHVQSIPVHDIVNANKTGSPRQIPIDLMEAISCSEGDQASQDGDVGAKSCLEQDQAWQDGNCNEDGESPFFDALSRLNSVKSTSSFYTFGSPTSQCENMRLQNEWGTKDELGFMDSAIEFETPRASTSENKSLLTHSQVETKMHANGEPSSLSQRFGKALKLETHEHMSVPSSHRDLNCKYPDFEDKGMLQAGDWRVESFPRLHLGSLDSKYPLSPQTVSPIFPAKCQSGSAFGWPFGISTYQSSRLETSPDHVHPEKRIKKYVPGLHVPSPPLPPSPKGSWLGKAVTRNASNTSPLATLQEKYKVASARKKLDFLVANENVERRWEDVVKESQVQTGHLRFSEELHQHHPLNHNEIQPLKL